MDWNDLFIYLGGGTYGYLSCRFFITARRRFAYRSGHDLPLALALIWGALWPVWAVLWVAAAVVLPFERRPASLIREPSKADRAARAMDQRKEQRTLAIQDWQHRASYWFELGKQAEAEDDQLMKWLVAHQLGFLLETQPEGAKVKGLTTSKEEADDSGQYFEPKEDLREEAARVVSGKKIHSTPPRQEGTNWVGFCNVCARYRKRDDLMMEGVCRECSEQQGLS